MIRDPARARPGAIRYGALLMILGSIEFVVGMAVAQYAFPCAQVCYNPLTNPISDLGNTVASPLWPVFNYSLALLSVTIIASLILVGNVFGKDLYYKLGVLFSSLAALGAMGVALVPENTILPVHSYFAIIAFLSTGMLMLLFGIAMHPRKEWKYYSAYSMAGGLFSIIVLLIFTLPLFGVRIAWATSGSGFGFGGMERLIVAPLLIWLVVIA